MSTPPDNERREHWVLKLWREIFDFCGLIEPRQVSVKSGLRVTSRISLFVLCGILLPLAAAWFEATTHFCAKRFFDPFPSVSHLWLFLLIPISNTLVWIAQRRDISQHYAAMALATGMASGVAVMYSLMFLPLMGLSLLFSLFLGFGLLGLAPALAMPCTMRSGKVVSQLAIARRTYFDPHLLNHIGHLIILIMVVCIELPSTLTRYHLSMASNGSSANEGIRWLRKYGDKEVMLRACYERSGHATDILGSLYESGHPVGIDRARAIFYRVTGTPFNTVSLPASIRATMKHAGLTGNDISGANAKVMDEFDLDADIGGEVVSGMARGLGSTELAISGAIDPDAMIGKLDWSISINNTSPFDREARLKLLLPAGSVVTAAKLSIDGEERDAAIMVRKMARTRYVDSVSTKRKDPLLVSTCGIDEVLVQCFPVNPGKTAKITLSMVSPLVMEGRNTGVIGLPVILEKNFRSQVSTQVALSSSRALFARPSSESADHHQLVSNLIAPAQAATSSANLNMTIPDLESRQFKASIAADRNAECESVFCKNTFSTKPPIIQRRISPEQHNAPSELVVVVDASKGMSGHLNEIATALEKLPEELLSEIVVVGDEAQKFEPKNNPTEKQKALASLRQYGCIAGQDDSPAVLQAVTKAAFSPGKTVIWVHGDQPVYEANKESFKKLIQQPGAQVLLYDVPVSAGPNEFLEGINSTKSVVRVARVGTLQSDLERLFNSWKLEDVKEFETPEAVGADIPGIQQTNADLAQLYAYREIIADPSSDAAPELAQAYHIVSPVSSAIVTEFVGTELKKVNTGISPEADFWLLLIVAGGLIGYAIISERKRGALQT